MDMLEYKQKNIALIQHGLELLRASGMNISEKDNENILKNWSETDSYHLHIKNGIKMFYSKRFDNITLEHADTLLSDIKTVVNASPLQPGDEEHRALSHYLLYLFSMFIGSGKLLRDRIVVEWMNIPDSYGMFHFIVTVEQHADPLDDLLGAIETIDNDYSICKGGMLIAAANIHGKESRKLNELYRKIFKQDKRFFRNMPEIKNPSALLKFLESIEDVEILSRVANSKENAMYVFGNFSDRCKKNPKLLEKWSSFIPAAREYPRQLMMYRPRFVGDTVLDMFLEDDDKEKTTFVVETLFHLLKVDYDYYLGKISKISVDKPDILKNEIDAVKGYLPFNASNFDLDLLERLLTSGVEELITPLLIGIGHRSQNRINNKIMNRAKAIMARIMDETPEFLTGLNAKWAFPYLRAAEIDAENFFTFYDYIKPVLAESEEMKTYIIEAAINDEESFSSLSDFIKPVAAESEGVRKCIKEKIKNSIPIESAVEKGWLDDKTKVLRDLTLDAMLEDDYPNLEVLKTTLSMACFTSGQKLAVKKKLKKFGIYISEEVDETRPPEGFDDMPDLDALLEKAKTVSIRKKKLFKDLWNDRYASCLEPLDVHADRWLLASLDGNARACTIAFALLSHVPEQGKKEFCYYLTRQWIEANVDVKYDWIIPFIGKYGDDRLVPPLFDALKKWKKGSDRQRGRRCLTALDQLDSAHSLACVYEAGNNSGYSDMIKEAAREIMERAAVRRNIPLMELADRLLPDFGMTEDGVTLDAGPRTYTVKLINDLTLRVINGETGRITKSFPKRKADEDPAKHEKSKKKFNYLKTNIRKVAKQQSERMDEYLILGREWDVGNWKKLFFEHPIFTIIARGVIWGQKRDDHYKCFRISEDKSLIDADDDEVELDESTPVSLWHPIYTDDGERASWTRHFDDYELKPLIPQATLSTTMPDPEVMKRKELAMFQGIEIQQGDLGRLMKKWHFKSEFDGSRINEFAREFLISEYTIELSVDDMDLADGFDDTVELEEFRIYNKEYEPMELGALPKTLIATLMGYGEELKRRAVIDE